MTPTIEELELAILNRAHEDAGRKLLDILTNLDANNGAISGLRMNHVPPVQGQDLERLVAVRLANAIGLLFAQPDFHLSDEGFFNFIARHRWIGTLFAATPLRNADHIIRMMEGVQEDGVHLKLDHPAVAKLCVLYTAESDLSVNCDDFWYRSPRLCAALLMALLSPRLTISHSAHTKRELILQWLPTRLDQLQTAAVLPQVFLHDVWMHCSYSLLEDKHAIKAPLNRLMRRQMLDAGLVDVITPYQVPAELPAKQNLMVVLEWFHANHSMYRCYIAAILALKERYHLVGVGMTECTDDTTRGMFDEFVALSLTTPVLESVQKVRQAATHYKPQIVYYPSVGMFPQTIYSANLRLAPIQIAGLGHPATTNIATIDYMVVDEDFLGDPKCFAERLILVPKQAMPYRPPAVWSDPFPLKPKRDDTVRVAVIGALMKINAPFLDMCRRIQVQAKSKVEFHFNTAFAIGLTALHSCDAIEHAVPGAVVHPMLPMAEYLECISNVDMFINPFPFGNTNTIVDAVSQGLAGVCRSHREVHSNIDEALFKRLGLPEYLVAHSEEEMIQISLKLIEDGALRETLHEHLVKNGYAKQLFSGEESLFCGFIVETQSRHPLRVINEPLITYHS
jgi:hypothetical protein